MAIPSKFGELLGKISDQGEKFNKLDSPKCRYYAFLSKIEDVSPKDMPIEDQTWAALFEIVPYEWIESLPEEIWESKTPLPISPASLIETDETKASDFAEALNAKVGEIDEGDWYILEDIEPLEEGSPRPAETVSTGKVVKGIRSDGDYKRKGVRTNVKGGPAPDKKKQKVAKKHTAEGKFIANVIKDKMGDRIPSAIGVMDVGQASCNLVYDINGIPIFYFDLGLPTSTHWDSMPDFAGTSRLIDPGPCLRNNPFVVLSHWDEDHRTMARLSNNHLDLARLLWVVPEQRIGPTGHNFLRRLVDVHVWPANLTVRLKSNNNRIRIIKCSGRSINGSGLAVVVNTSPNEDDQTWALLPGDAFFQHIPGIVVLDKFWMTAPHHGSDNELVLNQIPQPGVNDEGRLAYSYGIKADGSHCYNHPKADAIQAYRNSGWGGTNDDKVSATAERGPRSGENPRERGNIMMCYDIHPPDCGTPNCPFHHFKIVLE